MPAWARKSPKISELLPLPYLHGLSADHLIPALERFLGTAAGLSTARKRRRRRAPRSGARSPPSAPGPHSPRSPSTSSTVRSSPRRWPSSPTTSRNCRRFTTIPRNTGSTCGPRTRSSRPWYSKSSPNALYQWKMTTRQSISLDNYSYKNASRALSTGTLAAAAGGIDPHQARFAEDLISEAKDVRGSGEPRRQPVIGATCRRAGGVAVKADRPDGQQYGNGAS
jgi:hypothetical protein